MAGKHVPTEAKKKHNSLCNKLDGLITADSVESMKRMAMTYVDPKLVEKATSMNTLLHHLEVTGVLAVGKYDILIELMKDAGIGIGIDDIEQTNKDIQNIMQSSIHGQATVKKEKAVHAKHKISVKPSANKRKSKGKAPIKGTVAKKKSVSQDPNTNKKPLKEEYQSIESLTPSLMSWKIRARVTMKGEIATKRKKNSAGRFNKIKYFQFKVIDDSGEIEGVAFNDAADKFYRVLKMGKVFVISGATLTQADRKFNSTSHKYQIIINKDACIKPCQDAGDISPYGEFDFTTIDKLQDVRPGELVDIIAVVKECGECKTVETKKRKKLKKREIQLVDQSGRQVGLTLWRSDAEHFLGGRNPVLALKGVKVSDWAGRSLTMLPNSQKHVNPKIPEAEVLRLWFSNKGKQMKFTKFS